MNLRFSVREISIQPVIQAVNFLLAITAGIVAAYWSWQLWDLGSRPRSVAHVLQPQSASDTLAPISAPHTSWFGEGPVNGVASQTRQNIKLIGIFAGDKKSPGHAIITFGPGNTQTFQQGMEITNGEVINDIFPTYIILKRGGTLERLDIDRKPILTGLIQAAQRSDPAHKVTVAP